MKGRSNCNFQLPWWKAGAVRQDFQDWQLKIVERLPEGVAYCQGPVEHIWVTEVSFGRTKSAKKLVKGVARFWSTFRLKLPLTIRGLQIELREGSELPAWAARCAQHSPTSLAISADLDIGPACQHLPCTHFDHSLTD